MNHVTRVSVTRRYGLRLAVALLALGVVTGSAAVTAHLMWVLPPSEPFLSLSSEVRQLRKERDALQQELIALGPIQPPPLSPMALPSPPDAIPAKAPVRARAATAPTPTLRIRHSQMSVRAALRGEVMDKVTAGQPDAALRLAAAASRRGYDLVMRHAERGGGND